jgi:hypothetical protein
MVVLGIPINERLQKKEAGGGEANGLNHYVYVRVRLVWLSEARMRYSRNWSGDGRCAFCPDGLNRQDSAQ